MLILSLIGFAIAFGLALILAFTMLEGYFTDVLHMFVLIFTIEVVYTIIDTYWISIAIIIEAILIYIEIKRVFE